LASTLDTSLVKYFSNKDEPHPKQVTSSGILIFFTAYNQA